MARGRFALLRDRRWVAGAGVGFAVLLLLVWLTMPRAPIPPAPPVAAPPAPTATLRPTSSPSARPSVAPTPSRSPTPEVAGFSDGRLTVLLLGSDSDALRAAEGRPPLTDAIAVASVRADGTGLVLVSLPRDTADVPMPAGGVWTAKLNEMAFTLGPAATAETIGFLLGVEIDGHVQINMDDLVHIVNAAGGVAVDVPRTLSDAACTIEPGINRLDGALALCYARHRMTDDDYARAGRHQVLLLALRDALLAAEVDLPALVAGLGSLQTDLDLTELDGLVEVARRSQGVAARHLVLGPPEFTDFVGIAGDRGWISTPNVVAIRSAVSELLAE